LPSRDHRRQQRQILELDDLLQAYGSEMYAQVSEADWACVKVDGKIYAVPNNKEKAQGYGIAMVTSVLDALNYDVANLKTEDDLTELLRLVKANFPDMYPLVSDNGERATPSTVGTTWAATTACWKTALPTARPSSTGPKRTRTARSSSSVTPGPRKG
jgi:ABC-type glycerol-3-phosphate transport system substrate-binding protein